jgi:hypothetical protein
MNLGYDENFNKIDLLKQSEPGLLEGLSIKVFTGVFEALFDNYFNLIENTGIVISIDNQTDLPITHNKYFYLDSGYTHFIGMKKTVVQGLPFPFSECVDIDTYTSFFQADLDNLNLKYSKENCVIICRQYNVKTNCECSSLFLPRIVKTKPCLSDNQLNCSRNTMRLFDANKGCSEKCPPACEKVSYEFFRSSIVRDLCINFFFHFL